MASPKPLLQEDQLVSDQILITLIQMMESDEEEESEEEVRQRQDLMSLMRRIALDTGLKEVLQN